MNPGAIVEGLITGSTATGPHGPSAGGAPITANEVSTVKRSPGPPSSQGAATSPNWDEEFAKQTSLLAHANDRSSLLNRADASLGSGVGKEENASSQYLESSGRTRLDAAGLVAGLTSTRSESLSARASQGRSTAAGKSSDSKSSGSTKQHKPLSEEKAADSFLTPISQSAHSSLQAVKLQDPSRNGDGGSTLNCVAAEASSSSNHLLSVGLWNIADSAVEGGIVAQEFGSFSAIGSSSVASPAVSVPSGKGQVNGGKVAANVQPGNSPDLLAETNGMATEPPFTSFHAQSFLPVTGSAGPTLADDSGTVKGHSEVERIAASASQPGGLPASGISGNKTDAPMDVTAEEARVVVAAGAAGSSGGDRGEGAAGAASKTAPASAVSQLPSAVKPISNSKVLASGSSENSIANVGSRRGSDVSDGVHGSGKTEAAGLAAGSANAGSHSSAPTPGSVSFNSHPGNQAVQPGASTSTADLAQPGVTGSHSASRFMNQSSFQGLGDVNRNPFLAMDSEGSVSIQQPSPTGVSQLMVGHQDPALGYIELRAHLDGSGVHASLGTQSTAAGEALAGHLGSLTNWLNDRHTPVESLTVLGFNSQHDSSSSHRRDSGANGVTDGHGAGANTGQSGSEEGGQTDSGAGSGGFLGTAIDSSSPVITSPTRGFTPAEVAPALLTGGSISVVA
jgi:hypothetical protein